MTIITHTAAQIQDSENARQIIAFCFVAALMLVALVLCVENLD